MPGDEDIARLLPEPPPPRATRREAAIDAAMRRFDGETPAPVAKPVRAPIWSGERRTQLAAFASVAVVALVGVPLALTVLQREHAPVPEAAPVVVAQKAAPATPATVPGAVPAAPPQPHVAVPIKTAPVSASAPSPFIPSADACGKGDCARVPDRGLAEREAVPAPAPAPLPPPPPIVADRVAALRAPSAPPPAAKMADEAGMDVVVTGSRVRRPDVASRRGDWNACTVDDPARSLAGCGALANAGAKGDEGRAAARVAEGLSHAWNGENDGAVNDFSAAIAIQPRMAMAYLNRALVYQRLGESGRALTDLDRAVRYAPYSARGYYLRSLLRERMGDSARARADAERAVQIDARYRAVLDD